MIGILTKIFMKDGKDYNDTKVRGLYGKLCCALGIVLNIFLFAFKYFAGVLSRSVAIMADSFNNLSDAASSVISLVGFQLADKKPDTDHPFGHGRIEYISGLIVAALILVMGVELLKSSVQKILHPEAIQSSMVIFIILAVSIAVKIYMAVYNRSIGEKINSAAMKATATDSLGDAVATSVVFLCTLIHYFFHINIDGLCGVFVALFILKAGYGAAKDTVSPLLGQPPEPEFVEAIKDIVMSHDMIQGVHDLVVHDYGPGRCMISIHAEVPGNEDIFVIHDLIDRIEMELNEKLHCEAVIHMDPVAVNDEEVSKMRSAIAQKIQELDEQLTIHDFRMVKGPTHTNVIFDVVVPYDFRMTDEQVDAWIREAIPTSFENVFPVFKIDKSYV